MMQRVDVLSKENTFWELCDTFRTTTEHLTGLEVWSPDLARCGPVVAAVLSRETPIILVLPRWEAKSWWNVALRGCVSHTPAPPTHELFVENAQGFPRWEFCLFTFTF